MKSRGQIIKEFGMVGGKKNDDTRSLKAEE